MKSLITELVELGNDREAIQAHIEGLRQYGVPPTEIKRSLRDAFTDGDELSALGNEELAISEIDSGGTWGNLTVKVAALWEPFHDEMVQVGLIGNETGQTKFVRWDDEGPMMEEGETYELDSVVTDEYEGSFSVKLNSATTITPVGEDIEINAGTEVEARVVEIAEGAGFIERCARDDCSHVINNGRCREHGDVETEADLRVKVRLDTGDWLYIQQDLAEDLLDLTLQEAREVVMDALDSSAVEPIVRDKFLLSLVKVDAQEMYGDLHAQDVEFVEPDPQARAETVLAAHA